MKLAIGIVAFVSIYADILVTGSDVCKPWDSASLPLQYNDVCYLVYPSTMKYTWENANEFCKKRGGQLAKVKNDNTDVYFSQNLGNGEEYWLGLSRQAGTNGNGYDWVYTDGEISTFSLLLDPPNYMESTLTHIIYMTVWQEVNTCPWHVAQDNAQKRFICQYVIRNPANKDSVEKADIVSATKPLPTLHQKPLSVDNNVEMKKFGTTTKPSSHFQSTPKQMTPFQSSNPMTTTGTRNQDAEEISPEVMTRDFAVELMHLQSLNLNATTERRGSNQLECFSECAAVPMCVTVSYHPDNGDCRTYTDKLAYSAQSMTLESGWKTYRVWFMD